MNKHFIKTLRTARYYTLGKLNDEVEEIWFVFHGYGQLAEFFIRSFEILNDGKKLIIAPEALNKFYLSGFSGRVGATWMTKEEREIEIEDYLSYLDALFLDMKNSGYDLSKLKIKLLGFSQGSTTAYRWALHTKHFQPDTLILWAGIFPPDMNVDFSLQLDRLKDVKTYIIYGDKDPFLKEEHIMHLESFKEAKPDAEIIRFEGGHEIDGGVLERYF